MEEKAPLEPVPYPMLTAMPTLYINEATASISAWLDEVVSSLGMRSQWNTVSAKVDDRVVLFHT